MFEAVEGSLEECHEAELHRFLASKGRLQVFELFHGKDGDLRGRRSVFCRLDLALFRDYFFDGLIEAHLDERSDAAATPDGLDELVDEFEFSWSLGLELIENFLSQIFEDAGVFGCEDVGFAVSTVAERVEAGFEFAFAGFGASAFLGVTAIRRDLFFGCHGYLSFSSCVVLLLGISGSPGLVLAVGRNEVGGVLVVSD